MSNQIKVLSDSMIHKISAGEVIERPLSIVKELVENSIDANSNSITVEIKNGGINFIRVTDNGIGIPRDQVETAFMNHATSKIKQLDDFDNLSTLGFRGEALCTIAAVSQTEMITKTQTENLGTDIKIHGGKLIESKQIASNYGTTVISQNIFYNTPARLKFLKKPSVEANYISNMMNHFALSNPQISFKFINNGKVVFSTNGNGDLKSALLYIMGKDIAKNVLEINSQTKELALSGFIAKPEFSRNSRIHQNFFINGRYVKNKLMEDAIESAYKNRLMIGKFPVYVLNLQTKPSFVDVNVHPSKLEVRFANDDLIYNFIYDSINNAFKDKLLMPEYKTTHDEIFIKKNGGQTSQNIFAEARMPIEISRPEPISKANIKTFKQEQPQKHVPQKIKSPEALQSTFSSRNNFSQQTLLNKKNFLGESYKIIGCIFNTYWLIEHEENIYIMDQHAAHERILFEQITAEQKSKNISSQQLLRPVIINLTEYESKIFTDNLGQIKEIGFDIEKISEYTLSIKSVPHGFDKYISRDFFVDMINELAYEKKVSPDENNLVRAMKTACKKAIKAKDNISNLEVKELVRKIMELENPFNCPHGRPTIIKISKYEIEKLFGRKK